MVLHFSHLSTWYVYPKEFLFIPAALPYLSKGARQCANLVLAFFFLVSAATALHRCST